MLAAIRAVEDPDAAAQLAAQRFGGMAFNEYAAKLRVAASSQGRDDMMGGWWVDMGGYLAELEASLFSEGLHTLGRKPSAAEMSGYLTGCFEETPGSSKLPEVAIESLANGALEREVIAECVKVGRDSEEWPGAA
eukprot:Skav216255  [mRNA]  locus=scaffold20:239927:244001:- [translate_table: standard]